MSVTFVVVSVVLLCFRPIFPFSAFVLSFHFLLFNHFFSSGDSIQVHCVDLGESFPTRIYLQKSASIQPRTSPSKFGGKIQFNIHFTPYGEDSLFADLRREEAPGDSEAPEAAAAAALLAVEPDGAKAEEVPVSER